MKRKSILMTIVAVLFAGVAIGQIITPWPTTLGSGVKAADTIYFCERAETQFPIELGYDVSGRNLHPSYGNWSLVSKTSSSVTAIDYDTDVNVKNGGAGNAYKTVGSGKGGLLFQYNATNDLCGLGVGEKYWVYVFILPSESDIVYRDTLFCKDPSASTDTEIDFGAVFKEYIDLFKSVGFTGIGTDIKWLHGTGTGKQTASIKVPNIIPLQDTLVLAPGGSPKGKYDCGDTITFKVVVQVKDTISLTARGKHLCFDDTLSYLQGKTLSELFGREGVPGSYAASPALLPWGGTNVEKKLFTFTYKTCKVSPAAETETVTDTLYLHASSPVTGSYWGKDSLTFCRLASTVDIYKLLDLTTSAKPGITLGNSYWYDRNLGKFDFAPPGKIMLQYRELHP
jgi:hypothetical protein